MFLLLLAREQMDRLVESLIRLAEYHAQRSRDAGHGHSITKDSELVKEGLRRSSQMAAADASSLQMVMRNDPKGCMPKIVCAECGQALLWIVENMDEKVIAISPHACRDV